MNSKHLLVFFIVSLFSSHINCEIRHTKSNHGMFEVSDLIKYYGILDCYVLGYNAGFWWIDGYRWGRAHDYVKINFEILSERCRKVNLKDDNFFIWKFFSYEAYNAFGDRIPFDEFKEAVMKDSEALGDPSGWVWL